MQPIVENIECDGRILAVIIRAQFNPPGVHFVTPPEFSQQLAYMRHSAGKVIKPHLHNAVERTVQRTHVDVYARTYSMNACAGSQPSTWKRAMSYCSLSADMASRPSRMSS
jgi:hypothetical protein